MRNASIFLCIISTILGCSPYNKLTTSLEFSIENGLNNIMRGTKDKVIQKTIGTPEFVDREWEKSENLKYYNYYDKGIQISVKNEEVLCVFLYYKSTRFKKYLGSNNILVQIQSIEGVKSTFGEPDFFSQSVNKEHGEFPGQEETYISFDRHGIAFTFWNGELGDIRFIKDVKDRL